MMLAQAIDNIPAPFWKYFGMAMLVLLGIAVGLVTIYVGLRKPESTRINDEPAIKVEKVSKRFNHEATEQRFGRIETRLDGHDAEIDAAWNEMRELREANGRRYLNIAVSLTEIKTKLGIQGKSNLVEGEE